MTVETTPHRPTRKKILHVPKRKRRRRMDEDTSFPKPEWIDDESPEIGGPPDETAEQK